MKPLSVTGEWWQPGSDLRVAGSLTFSLDGGIDLELINSLGQGAGDDVSLLLGEADGTKFSLIDNICTNASILRLTRERGRQSFHSRLGLSGGHFASENELRFVAAEVSFTHLAEWAGIYPVHIDPSRIRPLQVTYDPPAGERALIREGQVEVFTEATTKQDFYHFSINQSVWWRFELDMPQSIETIMERFVRPIQNLLIMSTNRPNAIVDLYMYPSIGREQRFEVFYKPLQPRTQDTRPPHPIEMLYYLGDGALPFEQTLNRWLDLDRSLRSCFDAIFSSHNAPFMYVNHRFLNNVQAAEAFHREHLSPGSGGSLRERLLGLAEAVPITSSFFLRDQAAEFARYAARLRNDQAHRNSYSILPEPEKLAWSAEVLEVLIFACVLRHLGLPDNEALLRLQRVPRYAWLPSRFPVNWQ